MMSHWFEPVHKYLSMDTSKLGNVSKLNVRQRYQSIFEYIRVIKETGKNSNDDHAYNRWIAYDLL